MKKLVPCDNRLCSVSPPLDKGGVREGLKEFPMGFSFNPLLPSPSSEGKERYLIKCYTASVVLLIALALHGCNRGPRILWSHETNGPVYSTPAISGNTLIVGSTDGFLYALDLSSGKEVWKTKLEGMIVSKPLVESGYIFVGGGKNVYSLDPANGRIRWKFQTGGLIHYDPCGDESGIYFGSEDSKFYKISKEGENQWEFQAGMKLWGSCDFYKNLVFTSSWDSHFYGIDRFNGMTIWKQSSGTYNFAGPALFKESVYFASHTNLYRFDALSGKIISKATTGYLDNVLPYEGFLWTNDGGLNKRDADGKLLDSIQFKTASQFRPVPGNGFLIVAGTGNQLYSVSTGMKLLWEFEGANSFWASGMIHQDVYYTGNRDSNIYAFQIPK